MKIECPESGICQLECDDFRDSFDLRFQSVNEIEEVLRKIGHNVDEYVWYCPNGPNRNIAGASKCDGRMLREGSISEVKANETVANLLFPLPRERTLDGSPVDSLQNP
ncbi:MAG TPA: hypothetical protein VH234_01255 [Candidatus Saccharimonadales bacterium]|jgi:hypothetical protein|nr:hypothetical protein [Candidatus Saccharimonadales bacterium]